MMNKYIQFVVITRIKFVGNLLFQSYVASVKSIVTKF